MKKILILLLAVVFTFSIFAISACKKDDDSASATSTSSSVEENSSDAPTSRKSRTSKPGQSGSTASDAPTTSNGGGGGTSGNNGQVASGEKITLTSGDSSKSSDMNYLRYLVFIDEVNSLEVSEFSTYSEYLDYVSESLAKIDSAYNALPAAEKGYVADCKASCDAAKSSIQGLKDQAVADEFTGIYQSLSTVATLKNANVEAVYTLNDMIKSSESVISARVADYQAMKTQVANWMNTINASLVEYAYISHDLNNDGVIDPNEAAKKKGNPATTDKNNFFTLEHSGDSSASGLNYTDKLNNNIPLLRTVRGDIKFTTTAPGTLKLYLEGKGRRVRIAYNATNFGTNVTAAESDIILTSQPVDTPQIMEVKIPKPGTVTIWAIHSSDDVYQDGNLGILAINFNYPNLG